MYSEQLEMLIDMTLDDGLVTDKEMEILKRRAEKEGVDPDEFELYLQFRMKKQQKEQKDSSSFAVEKQRNEEERKAYHPVEKLKDMLIVIDDQYQEQINLNDSEKEEYCKSCAKDKMNTILTSMVVTSKSDLLDLLHFTKPLSNPGGEKNGFKTSLGVFKCEELSYAYWLLFRSCVGMAKGLYSGEKDYEPFIEYYYKKTGKTRRLDSIETTDIQQSRENECAPVHPVVQLVEELRDIDGKYRRYLWMEKSHTGKYDDLKKKWSKAKMDAITSAMKVYCRSDLLELMYFTKPLANTLGNQKGYESSFGWYSKEDLSYAFWLLYKSCVELAEKRYSDDPKFVNLIDFYYKQLGKPREHKATVESKEEPRLSQTEESIRLTQHNQQEASSNHPFEKSSEKSPLDSKIETLSSTVEKYAQTSAEKLLKKLWGKKK